MLLGTNNIADIKLGNNQVDSVYLGTNLVWQKPLLDKFPGAAAAYSLRRIRSAYTGSAIRVRRSSDNAEQDIGFIGQTLDVPSLLSFVGAGSGFVVTWYDQSGNGKDVTESVLANQPRIVNAGTLDQRGGKPAVRFDGTNDRLLRSDAGMIAVNSVSYFSVSNNDVSLGFGVVHSQSITTNNSSIRIFCDRRTLASRNLVISNTVSGAFFADLSATINSANQRLLSSFIDSSNNMSAFDNGNTGGTSTYSGSVLNTGLMIGNQGGVNWLNGTIQEIVIYNSNQSANRTGIEDNINQFYGIF